MLAHLDPFLSVSILLIVTPGPDTALTTRNALLGGRRAGVFTGIGVATGLAIWSLAAAGGIAAIVRASEPAFVAIKIVGAAYLVFLGGRALLGAIRSGGGGEGRFRPRPTAPIAGRSALLQGLINDLGNPKVAIFFTSLLPQFTSRGEASFPQLLVLASCSAS